MDDTALEAYLNETAGAMAELEQEFWSAWNARLTSALSVDSAFDIRDHADVFGGFRLSEAQYSELDAGLRRFFDSRSHRSGTSVLLRGYSYYACDPQVHRSSERPDDTTLWATFLDKWQGHRDRPDLSFLRHGPVSSINWIGALAYLEYGLCDLTTLHWFVLRKRPRLEARLGCDGFEALHTAIRDGVRDTAEAMAALLIDDGPAWFETLSRAADVYRSEIVNNFLVDSLQLAAMGTGDVRAVREADSMPLLLAAWEMKLRPHLARRPAVALTLLSNAFGALNQGEILAALARRTGTPASSANVQFSQHRAASGLFPSDADRVTFLDGALPEPTPAHEVILVDDCIFTGTSYEQISAWLRDRGLTAALLPLAIDLPSIRDYERDTRDVEAVLIRAKQCVAWATEVGDRLAPFQAFWDWSYASLHSTTTDDPDVREVMNGGDLLLKELWRRYPECSSHRPANVARRNSAYADHH